MAGDSALVPGETYSIGVGLIYIFNLIVGTGALTMPHAFSQAGWLLSLIIVVALAFMSYLTATFVVEAMASANALLHWRAVRHLKKVINEDENILSAVSDPVLDGRPNNEIFSSSMMEHEKVPLLMGSMESLSESTSVDYYNITERIELGKMASIFFNKVGMNAFYVCIAVYLYGDLAIYGAAVSKSLREISCTYSIPGQNYSNTSDISIRNDTGSLLDWPCWDPDIPVTRSNAYRIFLTIFLCLLGPFTFFNIQKTKYLQLLTTVLRWVAFISMIVLATTRLLQGKGNGHPAASNFENVPSLFGVSVYSFMCHHSLPSLVTPVRGKDKLFFLLASDYILILGFYSVLSFTGIFAFNNVADMYTLNFQPGRSNSDIDILESNPSMEYFLALFPVFTLSTNFPIIAITLRNNLKTLFLDETKQYSFFYEKIFFPLLTVLPPIAIAYGVESLDMLVSITGSYAGAGIQYVFPALLVFYARRDSLKELGMGVKNNHTSPFKHRFWVFFVLLWAGACIIIVTVDHILIGK